MEGVVDEHGEQHHDEGIGEDGEEHETEAELMDGAATHDGGEGSGTAGRVDAFELLHGPDGEADGASCGDGRMKDVLRTGDAYERGDTMSCNDRPWLGKLAVRHAKEQHGAGTHGGDESGRSICREGVGGNGNQRQNGESAAEDGDGFFSDADFDELDAEPLAQFGSGH